jgi:hypothetical protein
LYRTKINPLLQKAVDAPGSRETSAIVAMHDELDQPGI